MATRSGQDLPVDVIRIFTRGQPKTLTSGCEGRKFPRALSRPLCVNLTRPHTSKPPLDTAWGLPSMPHGAVAPRSLRGFPPAWPSVGRGRGALASRDKAGSPPACKIHRANKSSGADGLSDPVAMGTAVRWKRIRKGSYKKKAVFKTLTLSPPIWRVSMEAEQ